MRDAIASQSATRPARAILTAELLAIGTELTVGETTDTNSGELARTLVAIGVTVGRVSNLPDTREVVVDALRTALGRADLVVTTGGLGPTPDDLTREAVAEACGETPLVDEATLAWLRGLWARRRQPFPETNLKQAWVLPSGAMLPNPNGTAPGWWVDRPDGRVVVTLPGPPREMRPMWMNEVLPRLATRGVGMETEVRTLRLTGIGESQVAELLGESILRAPNPIVATYARQEAVDVRISARSEDGRRARELADVAEAAVLAQLEAFVWARGDTTWSAALAQALEARGWTLATVETGTGGALVGLVRGLDALRRAEVLADAAHADEPGDAVDAAPPGDDELDLAEADRIRAAAGADVGLSVRATVAGNDTAVRIAIVTPLGRHVDRRAGLPARERGRRARSDRQCSGPARRAQESSRAVTVRSCRPRCSPGERYGGHRGSANARRADRRLWLAQRSGRRLPGRREAR